MWMLFSGWRFCIMSCSSRGPGEDIIAYTRSLAGSLLGIAGAQFIASILELGPGASVCCGGGTSINCRITAVTVASLLRGVALAVWVIMVVLIFGPAAPQHWASPPPPSPFPPNNAPPPPAPRPPVPPYSPDPLYPDFPPWPPERPPRPPNPPRPPLAPPPIEPLNSGGLVGVALLFILLAGMLTFDLFTLARLRRVRASPEPTSEVARAGTQLVATTPVAHGLPIAQPAVAVPLAQPVVMQPAVSVAVPAKA